MDLGENLFASVSEKLRWVAYRDYEEERGCDRKWGIHRFAADELHAINACGQNSMRDTSFKVEVLSTFCTIFKFLL